MNNPEQFLIDVIDLDVAIDPVLVECKRLV